MNASDNQTTPAFLPESDIAVFGGTAQSGEICGGLCGGGAKVILCTATAQELSLIPHTNLHRRCGRMDLPQMGKFLRKSSCRGVICAVHPYAAEAEKTIVRACAECYLPCLQYRRPPTDTAAYEDIITHAASHEEAAELAFSSGGAVLLATGSNNAATYLKAARKYNAVISARVLDAQEIKNRMEQLGFSGRECIYARGPFSVEQNRRHIRQTGAKILISKDGGISGGMPQKLQAAKLEGCRVIIIDRPPHPPETGLEIFTDTSRLIRRALQTTGFTP